MFRIFQLIDIFGQPARIFINKKSAIHSDIGGIFTVCMFISILVFSWFIGKDIIYKLCPFSYQEEQISKTFPSFTINGTAFPFALAVMDFNSLPLPGLTYFQLNITIITTEVQPDGTTLTTYIPIELEPCESRHFPSLTEESFTSAGLKQCTCAKNQSLPFEGGWGEQKIVYLNIATSMCNYTAYPDWCKSNQEIQDYISQNGINMNLYYIDASVSLVNLTQPLYYYVKNIYKYFDTSKYKACEYFIQSDKIITDAGWLFEDKRELTFFYLQDLQCDTTNFNSDSKELLSLILYSSNKSKIYNRKYIKISDILASIGGLMQLFFVGFKILNIPFVEVKKYTTMIKEIYDINYQVSLNRCQSDQSHAPIICFSHQPVLRKNKCRIITTNLVSVENIQKKNQVQLLSENLPLNLLNFHNSNSSQERITFERCDTFKIICQKICLRNYSKNTITKFEFYENAKLKIQHYLDFINIILKLEEYEKLKNLILDDTQNIILKYNSKIRMTKESRQSQKDLAIDKNEFEKHANTFCKRFIEGKETRIDEKLAKLVNWKMS